MIMEQIVRFDMQQMSKELEAATMKEVNDVFEKLSSAMEEISKLCDLRISELGFDPATSDAILSGGFYIKEGTLRIPVYDDEIFTSCIICGKEVLLEPKEIADIIINCGFTGTGIKCDACTSANSTEPKYFATNE